MRPGALLLLLLALAGAGAGCSSSVPTGIAVLHPVSATARPIGEVATATFAVEPFPGIPGNVSDRLQKRLMAAFAREGLTVLRRPGAPATYRLDGTVTAVSDSTNSTLFYVFDIVGPAGRRRYRIRGQQSSDQSVSDPWASVTDDSLDAISMVVAARTKAWLRSPRV